jgi:hypothetical protein
MFTFHIYRHYVHSVVVENMNHGTSDVEPEKIPLQVVHECDKTKVGTYHVEKDVKLLTSLFTPVEKITGGISSHYLYSVYIIIIHLHHHIYIYTHIHPQSHTSR